MHSGYQLLIKKGRLRRMVAMFFLLFAFVDLMSPELCDEELSGAFTADKALSASLLSAGATTQNNTSIDSENCGQKEHRSQPADTDEDCFCCCSHLLPGKAFEMSLFEIQSPSGEPEMTLLPSSPPHRTFHPPRFS